MAEADKPATDKRTRNAFYGYAVYQDAARRFPGAEKAGSNQLCVFAAKKSFENAVSACNVIDRPPVKDAASGRA